MFHQVIVVPIEQCDHLRMAQTLERVVQVRTPLWVRSLYVYEFSGHWMLLLKLWPY